MKSFQSILSESLLNQGSFFVIEGELSEDQLMESAGALADIPNHIVKTMTKNHSAPAGENSEVNTEQVKAKTAMHVELSNKLRAGHHAVIRHNGRVIGSVHPSNFQNGARDTHVAHDADSSDVKTKQETRHVRGKSRKYGGQWHHEPDCSYTVARKDLTRGEAIDHVHRLVDAAGGYKGHTVTIDAIPADEKRIKKQSKRISDRRSDPIEDPRSFKSTTVRAGSKLVDKYQTKKESNKAIAKDLHAKLGKAIEDGDYKAARQHAYALDHHVNNRGLSDDTDSSEASSAKDDLARISSGSSRHSGWSSESFAKNLRRLKAASANKDS